ncbi:MAG: beta-galactosidase [Armatimonadota bacterium]|nr:beta-galactosidase [Armatimonadota bacterium]
MRGRGGWLLLWFLWCMTAQAQSLRLLDIRTEPFTPQPNLLRNASLEEVGSDGVPVGWSWSPRNTDATLRVVTDRARTGKRSLFITNGTPFGAHVYGMAEYQLPIPLQAGKRYTLSAYVYSPRPGVAWLGGGGGWQFRMRLPASPHGWKRVSMTFTPGEGDVPFTLRLITESPTDGIWVDDIKLEPGEQATPFADDSAVAPALQVEPEREELEIQGDGKFSASFLLSVKQGTQVELIATLRRGEQQVASLSSTRRLEAGFYRVTVQGEARELDASPRRLILEARSPMKRAEASTTARFYSRTGAIRLLDELKRRLPRHEAAVAQLERAGKPTQWARVSLSVLQNFVRYVEDDLNHRVPLPDGGETYPEVRRALMQLDELREVEAHLLQQLGNPSPEVPLWQCRGRRPRVENGSLVDESGKPLFFTGYGHFGQVRADIEKFPLYGINLIQIETGPSAVFPSDGVVSDAPIRELQQVLERAEKANVAVNLLISPHYFPEWMLRKYPHLRKRRDGFLQYCLHAPESQQLLRQYIRTLIPPLRRYPALQSICLSNEPVSIEEPCEYATRDWRRWLQRRHGDLQTLNRRWGTTYARWEDIPLPNPFDGNDRQPLARWYDYIRFNQEFFAGWHRMLAEAIREVAPDLPIHAKAMSWTLLNDGDVVYGVDAYLFSTFSDINGNDSINFYQHGEGDYAQGWLLNAMSHDLQRSVKEAPVFNSENHLIPDRETRSVPAQHVHTALWQAAIHGQCATTIWVWERTFDPRSDFAGSIMHRPACAEAVGRVNLLLNRHAREVTALQRAPADVALIDSVTAKVWDGGSYTDALGKLYEALSFTGLKVGFISERQLEEGQLPRAPVLLVAQQRHLSERAMETLRRYQGRIVFIGEGDWLSRNEYGQERVHRLSPAARMAFSYSKTTARDLWQALLQALPQWGLKPRVEIRDEAGNPVWGVAWRSAEVDGRLVVNLCNYRHDTVRLRLWRDGKPARYRKLEHTSWSSNALELQSLQTALIAVE